jgi:hypothetical protein
MTQRRQLCPPAQASVDQPNDKSGKEREQTILKSDIGIPLGLLAIVKLTVHMTVRISLGLSK